MALIFAIEPHIEMIFSDPPKKTETRRAVSYYKKGPQRGNIVNRCKVGSVHQTRKTMFGESHGSITILSVALEPLSAITQEQATAEGGYDRDEYILGFLGMSPETQYVEDGEIKKRPRTPEDLVWRVTFAPSDVVDRIMTLVTCSVCREKFWMSKSLADTISETSVITCSKTCWYEFIQPVEEVLS